MKSLAIALLSLGTLLAAGAARAQQDLEPGVQTSSAAAPTARPGNSADQAPAAAAAPAKAPGPHDRSRTAAPPAAPASAPAPPASGSAAEPKALGAKTGKTSDRIQLDTTEISGNRELPKVMYVVPWRRADPGDFNGRPLNSLLDEALTPVDRDVFRRQNRYYAALQAEPGAASPHPESKDEK
ncbi:MAG TPA: hypothetical protein VGF89_10455 [Steroidobacteraceae bacterium]|jgi:hypothetical protein